MYITTNKKIGCAPFSLQREDDTAAKGFATTKRATHLLKTFVLIPDESGKYKIGDKIFFKPESSVNPCAKEVFDVEFFKDGESHIEKVIFMPEEWIVLRFQLDK